LRNVQKNPFRRNSSRPDTDVIYDVLCGLTGNALEGTKIRIGLQAPPWGLRALWTLSCITLDNVAPAASGTTSPDLYMPRPVLFLPLSMYVRRMLVPCCWVHPAAIGGRARHHGAEESSRCGRSYTPVHRANFWRSAPLKVGSVIHDQSHPLQRQRSAQAI
jgi:hypothetical protein